MSDVRRHRVDDARSRRAAARFCKTVKIARPEVTAEDDALYRAGLRMSDLLADDIVSWMDEVGHTQGRRALEAAIEGERSKSPAIVALMDQVTARPNWVDDAQLVEGARVAQLGGLAGMRVLLVAGLLAGYRLSAVNQTLLATGNLERGARRRVAQTTKWWVEVTRDQGMARACDGFKNTLRVRVMHALVRKKVRALDDWDEDELGLPVNQTDMQITIFGFSLIYWLGLRAVGVQPTDDEGRALMHLWRYIAWVMGVDERFLFDLDEPLRSALEMFHANLSFQAMADQSSKRLAASLVDEALERGYPRLPRLTGRYNRALQLSIARLVLDPLARQELGLETPVVPWYPLMVAPVNLVLHPLARALGARDWLARRGGKQQAKYLEVLL